MAHLTLIAPDWPAALFVRIDDLLAVVDVRPTADTCLRASLLIGEPAPVDGCLTLAQLRARLDIPALERRYGPAAMSPGDIATVQALFGSM